MNDAEREERSIWKLEQAGCRVTRPTSGLRAGWYVVVADDGSELASLAELAALVELADAIYAVHWTQRRITPSA